MATNREKVIYNITLQSEEDDEVKVIERFILILLKPFFFNRLKLLLSYFGVARVWRRCRGSEKSAADYHHAAVSLGRKVLRWSPENHRHNRWPKSKSAVTAAVGRSEKSATHLSEGRSTAATPCRRTWSHRCGRECVVVVAVVVDAGKAMTRRKWRRWVVY